MADLGIAKGAMAPNLFFIFLLFQIHFFNLIFLIYFNIFYIIVKFYTFISCLRKNIILSIFIF